MKRLELGGGDSPVYRPNLDCRKITNVDVVHDCHKLPLPFSDESYDLVFSKHFLEHVAWNVFPSLLRDIYRILKCGGCIELIVPNVAPAFEAMLEGDMKVMDKMYWIVWGEMRDPIWDCHRNGFTPKSLKRLLTDVGFIRIEEFKGFEGILDIHMRGFKKYKGE